MAMTDRAGFIYKEGIKVTNWKQRWMVIERIEGRISYYVKENCREKKGEILISTIRGVEEMPGKYKNKPYVFAIHTTKSKGDKEKEGRTYYIHAADEEGRDSWIAAIKAVIPKSSQPETLASPRYVLGPNGPELA